MFCPILLNPGSKTNGKSNSIGFLPVGWGYANWFPSIFLYLVLAGLFSGTCYFIYNTWVATLFPPKPRGGKGSERAKRSSLGSKKVDAADQVSVAGAGAGADGLAVASGAKAYDESWIPAHHLNRPEARRVKSGAGSGRSKSRGKAE